MRVIRGGGGQPAPPIVEDSYEPGTVEDAWREYCTAHGRQPYPRDDTYSVFRSGWRRGFGQGSNLAVSTFVHSIEDD